MACVATFPDSHMSVVLYVWSFFFPVIVMSPSSFLPIHLHPANPKVPPQSTYRPIYWSLALYRLIKNHLGSRSFSFWTPILGAELIPSPRPNLQHWSQGRMLSLGKSTWWLSQGLTSNPQYSSKKPGMAAHPRDPSTMRSRTGGTLGFTASRLVEALSSQ